MCIRDSCKLGSLVTKSTSSQEIAKHLCLFSSTKYWGPVLHKFLQKWFCGHLNFAVAPPFRSMSLSNTLVQNSIHSTCTAVSSGSWWASWAWFILHSFLERLMLIAKPHDYRLNVTFPSVLVPDFRSLMQFSKNYAAFLSTLLYTLLMISPL